jgi:1-acyl-sn-glycerol-3-phosphate acyltransferase
VGRVNRVLTVLRRRYFRAEVRGLARLPDGPAMIVGNHDGGYIPADALCFGSAYYERAGTAGRRLFVLMHDFPFRIAPAMTAWLGRLGLLRASRDNAARVLAAGQHLLVFPGGARESFRPYWERRRINLGHRTGFVAAALRRGVPIVPMVSVGAHETLLVLSRGAALARRLPLARRLRSDVVPLWLGLPFGVGFGPLPNLPLPAKIEIELLQPIDLRRELGRSARPDDARALLDGLALVRGRMQRVADRLYRARRWPLIG